MDDLIRASICDLIRSDNVQQLIDEGIFKSADNHKDMQKDAGDTLPFICTEQCKNRVGNNLNQKKKSALMQSS